MNGCCPARRAVAAAMFFAFDALTILPAMAGAYCAKCAANIDVVYGVDMLPDPAIESLMTALARQVARLL